jgi:predicted hydrocarbon binding protein
MSLKKHLAKRYIPSSTKWKLVLKGVGKLYRAVYDELEKDEKGSSAKALADAAYRVGLDFGETLKKDFGLGNSIEDVAFAMEIDHKIFGVKAVVAEKDERKIVYHCYQCAWRKYFTPKLCIAIGQAEKGIAHALNSEAKYHVLQTRTMGKDRCIIAIEI